MRNRRLAATLAAVIALLAVGAPAAVAATCPNPKTTLGDLEDEVMCPRCGTPLSVVDSEPLANRERAFIRDLIDQCRSKDEIKTALVAQFGPEVLATPEHKGFDLAAYWVPIVLGAAALVAIAFTALRWRGGRRGADPTAGITPVTTNGARTMDEADSERLNADLDRYEL
jgi:cytochrome c-type biogenesis protein CcmH/NrfF